jgi:crossover junction endodeoxyribonuclease RuvC
MPPMSKILGVDPGTRVAGWGVVEGSGHELAAVAAGVVRAPEGPIEERLRAIFEGLRQVLADHEVAFVAVEEAFYGKNVRSAIRLGEGRAAAILAAALSNVPVVELAPSLVKKAVTGHGGATKEQVRSALEATLGGTREAAASLPMDATDALALAVAAHARTSAPGGAPRRRRRTRVRWTGDDLARLGLSGDEHG